MTRLAFLFLILLALCGFSRIPSELFRAEALAKIAVEQAASGDPAEASETLALARDAAEHTSGENRVEALSHIAWAQASMGDSAGALATAESIEELGHRVLTLCRIALAQGEAGDESAARHTAGLVLDELQDEPEEASGWIAMSASVLLGLFGQAAGALALAEYITDLDDKTPFLLGLAAGQVESGDRAGARRTVALASEAVRRQESPDPGTELALAWLRAKTGDWAHAIDTAERLSDPAIGALALGLVATVQAVEGDAADARETANRTLAKLEGLPADAGEDVDETTILIALARSAASVAQAAAGDLPGGPTTATGARQDGLRAWVLAALATARAASGDRAGARQILTAARDLAQSIEDSDQRTEALTAVLQVQAETGDLGAARETLAAIRDSGIGDTGFSVLTVPWGRLLSGDAVGAFRPSLDFLAGVRLFGSDWGRSAVIMARLQARSGAFDAALETATSIHDSLDRDDLLSRGARLQSWAGDRAGAVETAVMIEDPRWRSSRLSELAQAQFRAGEAEAAAATFALAVAAARWIEGPLGPAIHAGAEAIAGVAWVRARAGDLEGAEATFAEALIAAEAIATPEDRARAEKAIEQSRAAARELTTTETEEGGSSPAEPLPAEPALDRAAAERLPEPLARVRALGALARWRAARGDTGDARQLARRATRHARAITLAPLRALALLDATQALEAAGDRAAARQALALLGRTAEGLASLHDRGLALVSLAEILAEWGDMDEAHQAALSGVSAALQMEVSR